MATSCEWRTAEWNSHGKSWHGTPVNMYRRMGLGTAYKAETSKIENVSIKSSGRKKLCLWVEENCVFTEKFIYMYKG
jgi:hypothetical protein